MALDDHKPVFGSPVAPWHWWFAWHPIWTWDGRFAFFRYVKRRLIQKHIHLTGGPETWWEYEMEHGYVDDPR